MIPSSSSSNLTLFMLREIWHIEWSVGFKLKPLKYYFKSSVKTIYGNIEVEAWEDALSGNVSQIGAIIIPRK